MSHRYVRVLSWFFLIIGIVGVIVGFGGHYQELSYYHHIVVRMSMTLLGMILYLDMPIYALPFHIGFGFVVISTFLKKCLKSPERTSAYLNKLSFFIILVGLYNMIIGLIPPLLLYPGKNPEINLTNLSYWEYILFEDIGHWIWQIGMVVILIGVLIKKKKHVLIKKKRNSGYK